MNANLHKTVGLLKTLYDFSLCVCVCAFSFGVGNYIAWSIV